MEKLDNVVIKNTSLVMGKKIIKYFQEIGYDTGECIGSCIVGSSQRYFYGVSGENFGLFSAEQVKKYNLTIINLPEEEKQFTKSDLKAGMWVETRNGNQYLVLTDVDSLYDGPQKLAFINNGGCLFGNSNYNDDLTRNNYNDFDIMKVYSGVVDSSTYRGISSKSKLIWERKEVPVKTKLTLEQLAEKAGYKVDGIEITVNKI